jgi:hypothetical protein
VTQTSDNLTAINAIHRVTLVMNEQKGLVYPKNKTAKCWDYDISHGAAFGPSVLTAPIGGMAVNIRLLGTDRLDWVNDGKFWFLEVQAKRGILADNPSSAAHPR